MRNYCQLRPIFNSDNQEVAIRLKISNGDSLRDKHKCYHDINRQVSALFLTASNGNFPVGYS